MDGDVKTFTNSFSSAKSDKYQLREVRKSGGQCKRVADTLHEFLKLLKVVLQMSCVHSNIENWTLKLRVCLKSYSNLHKSGMTGLIVTDFLNVGAKCHAGR